MSIQSVLDYSFINAKIRGKKSKFLSAGDYERFYKASSLEELARLLSGTGIGIEEINQIILGGNEQTISSQEVDRILSHHFYQDYTSIPLPKYTNEFTQAVIKTKFFIEALKIIIRGKHLNLSKEEIQSFIVTPFDNEIHILDRLIDIPNIPQLVDDIPDSSIRSALQDALTDYDQTKSTLPLEMALYKAYYKKIWKVSSTIRKSDYEGVFSLFGTELDLINLLGILRSKKLKIDPDTTRKWLIPQKHRLSLQTLDNLIHAGQMSQVGQILITTTYRDLIQQARDIFESTDMPINEIENLIKKYLVHKAMRILNGSPFHLGIFFAYLQLAKTQFENIRAIIIGKLGKLTPEMIREELIFF
ncbi:MAG: V-type ATPase subunit [Candidatus Hodarchaeales archaeon]|jgi:vacuolar-type H+-ATPase subunit C/Vma6